MNILQSSTPASSSYLTNIPSQQLLTCPCMMQPVAPVRILIVYPCLLLGTGVSFSHCLMLIDFFMCNSTYDSMKSNIVIVIYFSSFKICIEGKSILAIPVSCCVGRYKHSLGSSSWVAAQTVHMGKVTPLYARLGIDGSK